MTDWTEHDGYTLRNALRNHPELGDCDLVDVCARAAAHIADLEEQLKEVHALAFSLGGKLDRATAHIEALEARVERLKDRADARERVLAAVQRMCDERESRIATLEAERANTIPRAVLVSALREVAQTEEFVMRSETDGAAFDARREYLIIRFERLADEIERGEWPQTTEGETK